MDCGRSGGNYASPFRVDKRGFDNALMRQPFCFLYGEKYWIFQLCGDTLVSRNVIFTSLFGNDDLNIALDSLRVVCNYTERNGKVQRGSSFTSAFAAAE